MTTLRHYLRTPKGLTLALFIPLLAIGAIGAGWRNVVLPVGSAVAAAMLFDLVVLRMRKGRWIFPDGALLTALIVAMILSPHERWWIAPVTSLIGVASKYVVRVRKANVFNPAALGLVATFYMYDTGQSWWGALGDLSPWALALLIAAGWFAAYRIRKLPGAIAFLGAYFLLATVAAFLGNPRQMAELFEVPDLNAAIFFAFFMVTDPPTSPGRGRDQVFFAALTAVVAFGVFRWIGAAYYLLAGVLVANLWDAWVKHADTVRRQHLHAMSS
ncbi:MAG TPA: RnfABCDGE type electron transport complex subunit D [Gemmatimonadaceae bacterium]